MSYTALYRKFRPQNFEDVKGQEHIVTTLKNQIRAERVGHAYLFCGTRGTGKTTVAKIFAKAINCEHPVEGSPCGTCAVCQAIAEGSSMNVIEIDAASNNGVENIRQIRDEVAYSPTEGRYKVYIIDEVHMLSTGAFNALLKTLEEPPPYVVFILATTEVHKIPITILSRCQRYDFRRISIDTISGRLMELMEKEQVDVEEKAVRYVAKAADGSMRDALSLLDQCIAFYLGETLTYDKVLDVLGAVDTEVFSRLLRYVLNEDVAGAITLLDELVLEGRELGQFVIDFTWYLRNLMLLQGAENMEDVLDMSTENLALLKEEAGMVSQEVLIRYIRVFSELSNQIKYSTQKRILTEISIIKLCKPEMELNVDAITNRLEKLEKKLEEGVPVSRIVMSGTAETAQQPVPEKPPMPKAIPEEVEQAVKSWNAIQQQMSGMQKSYMKQAHLSLAGDNRLMIVFDDPVAADFMSTEEHRKEISRLISEYIGRDVEVVIDRNQSGHAFEDAYIDLSQIINMDITFEEEQEDG